eukprot:TRINITY_DN1432_c0_g2_i2.p1 TRINITY_DN1432_c0_g2~~TRINITY_DN1432_c0_g2_i2.p1  ORF type:complete len:683 (-),score=224.60 TRINITY_DN1432_c0_g2_i2:311-2359(-)
MLILVDSVTSSDKVILVGRESKTVQRYVIGSMSLDAKFMLKTRPQFLAVNCDSTKMSIIDHNMIFSLFDMEGYDEENGQQGVAMGLTRKDVWEMMWAEDNPDLFAFMEKTSMYIFRGTQADEQFNSSGYIARFKDLNVTSVLLDEVMAMPQHPRKDHITKYETKSLRDTRELVQSVGLAKASQFIEDNPHPMLWRYVAEAALEALDFPIADKAFVRCGDYQGIQFVKRIRVLDDPLKQQAEVAAYFKKFETAESIYQEIDRKDLAIDLQMRLGNWRRVLHLLQQDPSQGSDEMLRKAWSEIGDYYFDRQKWDRAVKFYQNSDNNARLAECYYVLDDYDSLQQLAETLPSGTPLLDDIGDKFISVGMTDAAVACFLKVSKIDKAVDSCVLLNEWDTAVALAEKHRFSRIENLLSNYASHLLEKNETLQAIELYRKASHHQEAARLLLDLADTAGNGKQLYVRAKKLSVLAALEVEFHRQKIAQRSTEGGLSSAEAQLSTLLNDDQIDPALAQPWRSAEAYHFLLLAQRQLYEGNTEEAMITAIRLTEYDDILDAQVVYALVALTSYYNKHYGQCSKAFIKLEAMDSLSKEQREQYEDLAMDVFIKYVPRDPISRSGARCPSCDTQIHDWSTQCEGCGNQFAACIASGRPITDSHYFQCRTCKHGGRHMEVQKLRNCPLCHSLI